MVVGNTDWKSRRDVKVNRRDDRVLWLKMFESQRSVRGRRRRAELRKLVEGDLRRSRQRCGKFRHRGQKATPVPNAAEVMGRWSPETRQRGQRCLNCHQQLPGLQ